MTNQENKRPLSPSKNAEEAKPALRLDVFTIFLGTTHVALTLVPWYGFTSGYSTGMWVAFAVFMFWNGLSITAGYHRLWSHKTYKAHPAIRVIFAIGGALAVQNSIEYGVQITDIIIDLQTMLIKTPIRRNGDFGIHTWAGC